MKKSYLIPCDSQKSFYNKAVLIETGDGEKMLQSYNTIVCKVTKDGDFVKTWGGYSATTARHVQAFRLYCGLPGINKKAWDALPCGEA